MSENMNGPASSSAEAVCLDSIDPGRLQEMANYWMLHDKTAGIAKWVLPGGAFMIITSLPLDSTVDTINASIGALVMFSGVWSLLKPGLSALMMTAAWVLIIGLFNLAWGFGKIPGMKTEGISYFSIGFGCLLLLAAAFQFRLYRKFSKMKTIKPSGETFSKLAERIKGVLKLRRDLEGQTFKLQELSKEIKTPWTAGLFESCGIFIRMPGREVHVVPRGDVKLAEPKRPVPGAKKHKPLLLSLGPKSIMVILESLDSADLDDWIHGRE